MFSFYFKLFRQVYKVINRIQRQKKGISLQSGLIAWSGRVIGSVNISKSTSKSTS